MKIYAPLLLLICGFTTVGFAQTRQPDLIVIPDGYVGWIQVNYGVKDAPVLPNWNGFRLHKFGRDGQIRTSSSTNQGWAKDKYFYSTKNGWKPLLRTVNGGNGRVWAPTTSSSEIVYKNKQGKKTKARTPETFTAFIGTWRQFHDPKFKRPQLKAEKAANEANE